MIMADFGRNVILVDRYALFSFLRDHLIDFLKKTYVEAKVRKHPRKHSFNSSTDVFIKPFRFSITEKQGFGPDVIILIRKLDLGKLVKS